MTSALPSWRFPSADRFPEESSCACIPSATLHGVDGRPVTVEVHVSSGLPCFTVVGLPDAAVRESRDRGRAALLSSGLSWPMQRITVNLAPATSNQVTSGPANGRRRLSRRSGGVVSVAVCDGAGLGATCS